MPQAEGMMFQFQGEEELRPDLLESIEYTGSPQTITYETDEFNAVCPFSGLPDFARLVIKYVPAGKIVELKSLKYYIISFRHVGIYQEAATNRIYHDLYRLLSPSWLNVETVYNVRGGILSTCVMDSSEVASQEQPAQ